MKTAFVHDWLIGMAGGEKVLEALCELLDGPIYTLLKDDKALQNSPFLNRTIYTSYLQKFPHVNAYYRNLLPFFPSAIEKFDLSEYDLILSNSHAVAKGIPTQKHQIHICYCNTPMRYAWDLNDFHLAQLNLFKQLAARPILKYLRHWDRKTASRVTHFIANSKCVANRIKTHYNREATVIYPPVDTHLFDLNPKREDYYITCSRLVPYKRVDLLVGAFAQMPDKKLLIIGSGPELRKLKSKATKNIEFLGQQPNTLLRETVARARGFVFAAEEDFGIAPVEAQAAGVPVIAYGSGGSLETVLPGRTGVFFKKQTVKSLISAVTRFDKMRDDFEPEKIKQHATQFSKDRFQKEMQAFIDKATTQSSV